MDEDLIMKAMEGMGWANDCELPMANEANRQILLEIKALREKKDDLLERQSQTHEKLEKLQQHSKNSEVSINHNLKLLLAYQSELRTESHMLKLSKREHSKLKQDLKEVEKEWHSYKKYIDYTENEMSTRKQCIDKYINRIKWAKTALVEWRQAMEDGNKGMQLIEMYFKDDQLKAKQQNQKRQKLNAEIEKNRQKLVELYNEQKTMECNLECTANLYRSAHAERRQMVEIWKQAVNQMTQREVDIRHSELHLIELKRQGRIKLNELRQKDNRLSEMIDTNHQVEQSIEELNYETSELRDQMQKMRDSSILKTNDLELLQKDLQNLAHRVEQRRQDNRRSNKENADLLTELEQSKLNIKKLEERYEIMTNKNMNAEQRLQALEDLMDHETRTQKSLSKETDRINALIYRSQLHLSKIKEDVLILQVAKDGVFGTMTAIRKNMQDSEKELKRQTEIHYELSFKILMLERKILVLQGGVIDPEQEQKNLNYLAELETLNNKLSKNIQITQMQNRKLEDDMRKLTVIYNDDMKLLDEVNFKIKEAQVYCEGGVKRIKDETHRNQELIVELSILKMKANEFEMQINECEDSSYNLKKHRLHLNRTIKDRMIAIKSQMDVLNLKRKHLIEELSTLKADIGERKKHIEAVKARFELTTKLLGRNEDGSLITATQLRVELAQEKQLLLDEGNALNEKVLRAEADIRAMENTLALVNNSNDNFRRKLQNTQDGEETATRLRDMQDNYCASLQRLKQLRTDLFQIEQKSSELEKERNELEKLLNKTVSRRMENCEILAKFQKELLDQQNKLMRADRELKVSLKTVKQRAISPEFLEIFNKDLDLRDLEKRNRNALNQLADFADNDATIGPKIIRNIMERGMKMPHMLQQKCRSSMSWRSDASLDVMSMSSSREFSTSVSSLSQISQARKSSTTRLSVISLELPVKNMGKY